MGRFDTWEKASRLRREFGEDLTSPVDIFSLAHSISKLTIVFYPMGEHISGMCVKSDKNTLIAINSGMTFGRQRFSLAHEFYHMYYDDVDTAVICAKNIGGGSANEKEADQFASFFLMPPNALTEFIIADGNNSETITLERIVAIEQYFQISRQAVLYRLISDNRITPREAEPMRENIMLGARRLGYDDALYRPAPEKKRYATYGKYIKLAREAVEKGLISDGKYDELMLCAYRADLVYGDDEGGDVVD